MSSINSVRKLQILYFNMKNKKIKNLKNGEKKWLDIGIYTYYSVTSLNVSRSIFMTFYVGLLEIYHRQQKMVIDRY